MSDEFKLFHYGPVGKEDPEQDLDEVPHVIHSPATTDVLVSFVRTKAAWLLLIVVAIGVVVIDLTAAPNHSKGQEPTPTKAPMWQEEGEEYKGPTVNLFAQEYATKDTIKIRIRRHNYHTRTIPTQIGLLTNLEYLDLQQLQLIGRIPSELGLLSKLTTLHLNTNQLWHEIPSELGLLSNQLVDLSLRDNKLDGTLPSQIGCMSKLTSLHLGDNQLSGSLPSEVGCLSELTDLSLSNNLFSGSIPSELGHDRINQPPRKTGIGK